MIHQILGYVLTLSFVFATPAFARDNYEIPANSEVLVATGAPSAPAQNDLRVLVWNIEKAGGGEAWQRDFVNLVSQSDLALVQEAYTNPYFRRASQLLTGFLWLFAVSFYVDNEITGVASVSRWPVQAAQWHRSSDREPVLATPKMALSTIIPLPDGRPLMVVNVHALNFVFNGSFERQIAPLARLVGAHQGPAIFAGDFNTWNIPKGDYLDEEMKRAGLAEVPIQGDERYFRFDRVYYRGLGVRGAALRTDVQTSDHSPVQVVFSTVNAPVSPRSLARATP